MNLIDCCVTKVIEKKKFVAPDNWATPGKVFDIFVVEYSDCGGDGKVAEIWCEENENMDIQPGYIFQS